MLRKQFADYCSINVGLDNCIYIQGVGFVPPDYYINIPCGTCYHCLQNKRRYWVSRLLVEIDQHRECSFITLTFDDENLLKFKGDYKYPLKLYLDRLRKHLGYRPRYWFTTELGDEEKYSGRLHFHGIFFGTSKETLSFAVQRNKWAYGISYVGYVQYKTAYYLTKYLLKQQPSEDYKPFIMCSNGIGSALVSDSTRSKIIDGFDFKPFIELHGKKFPISPYYKAKLFNSDILLCNMINRSNELKKSVYFRGSNYSNDVQLKRAKEHYFVQTLLDGLSLPLKPIKTYSNKDIVGNSEFLVNNILKTNQLKHL